MPRIIEERWVGVGYQVITEHLAVTDPNGNVVHDAAGLPKTQEHRTLVFILPMPDGQRVVRVPFTLEAKDELVRQLTGGIVIANGHTPA